MQGVIAYGEGVRASPITFGEGYAPVPLYPFGVRGTCVAKGEGVKLPSLRSGNPAKKGTAGKGV